MGEAAARVQSHLREHLARSRPGLDWHAEYDLGGTPVDVAGVGDGELVLVELEWRRADPSNNTVKLFRNLVETDLTERYERVRVVQLFSRYYDLASGGVSTKRTNAAFAGKRVSNTLDGATFEGVTLDVVPPKRGGDLPTGWRDAVARAAEQV